MYSVFGSFKKVLLSEVQAPEIPLVLHSLQVRPLFCKWLYSGGESSVLCGTILHLELLLLTMHLCTQLLLDFAMLLFLVGLITSMRTED